MCIHIYIYIYLQNICTLVGVQYAINLQLQHLGDHDQFISHSVFLDDVYVPPHEMPQHAQGGGRDAMKIGDVTKEALRGVTYSFVCVCLVLFMHMYMVAHVRMDAWMCVHAGNLSECVYTRVRVLCICMYTCRCEYQSFIW